MNKILFCCCFVLSACGQEAEVHEPEAIPQFSPDERESNADIFARLVNQLCIQNGGDRAQFERAVRTTDWNFSRIQTLDPAEALSVDVWVAGDARLIFGRLVGDEVLVCNVAISDEQTDGAAVINALSRFAEVEPIDGHWEWQRNGKRFVMDFGTGSDPDTALSVNVEIWN